MPVKGAILCGAKCRSKGGEPCEMTATKGSGYTRCKMHGGNHYKNKTHGKTTKRAKEQRKKERDLLREMKAITMEIRKREPEFRSSNARV